MKAAKAEAAGDLKAAKACHEKAVAIKDDAKVQWNRGVTVNPNAADNIDSNLGYAYDEANDLDKAEWHLNKAVEMEPNYPRPRNNLGRVLWRRSQQLEAEAREAEAKGRKDPAEAAKVPKLRAQAKRKLAAAIQQFQEAIHFDYTLLDARLNLGEVYIQLNELDEAETQYREIVRLHSVGETHRETLTSTAKAGSA